jgi:hypothetical protein
MNSVGVYNVYHSMRSMHAIQPFAFQGFYTREIEVMLIGIYPSIIPSHPFVKP